MNNYQRHIMRRRRSIGGWPVAVVGIALGVYGLVLCYVEWARLN